MIRRFLLFESKIMHLNFGLLEKIGTLLSSSGSLLFDFWGMTRAELARMRAELGLKRTWCCSG